MLVGAEIIPSAVDAGIARLSELAGVLEIVKLRQPRLLDRVLPAGTFLILTRPESEGRDSGEIVNGFLDWQRAFQEVAGSYARWYGHILSNEPNHPESPYRGPDGAAGFAPVLQGALATIGPRGRRLIAPPLVPYYGTGVWVRMLSQYALIPAGHCYQNGGDVAGAIAECIAMAGPHAAAPLVADEVGDTSGADDATRTTRLSAQFRGLARSGVACAILFPLAGAADNSRALNPDNIRAVLAAARETPRQRRRRKEPTMPEFVLGFKAYAEAHPDEVGDPLEDQQQIGPGYAIQFTGKGVLLYSAAANAVKFFPDLDAEG